MVAKRVVGLKRERGGWDKGMVRGWSIRSGRQQVKPLHGDCLALVCLGKCRQKGCWYLALMPALIKI